MTSTVRTLWERRGLLRELTRSQLRRTHRNTWLGSAWWLLDPLLMTLVYTLVVTLLRGGRPGPDQPYPLFVMCGLVAWKFFAASVTDSMGTLAQQGQLIRSYVFPRAVLPLACVLAQLIQFCVGLLPVIGLACVYAALPGHDVQLGWRLVWIPLLIAVELLLATGAALMLAGFAARYRDLAPLTGHLLRIGWFLSPGLYGIASVLPGYGGLGAADWSNPRSLFLLNPMAHLLEAYRAALLHDRAPDAAGIALAACGGALLVVLGMRLFQSQEAKLGKLV